MGIKIHPVVEKRMRQHIDEVARSGDWSVGSVTERAEEAWGQMNSLRAVATSNGTTALQLAGQVLRSESVSKAMIPALAPPMVGWAMEMAGYRICHYDVDPVLGVPRIDDIEAAVNREKPGIIVLVHNSGVISPDMQSIADLCSSKDITLIEDCSHAHFCSLNGRMAGSWGPSPPRS